MLNFQASDRFVWNKHLLTSFRSIPGVKSRASKYLKLFSQRYACELHPDVHIPELEPRLFSFNAPQGACETCSGLGTRMEIDPELVLSQNLTISEGAIRPYNRVNEQTWRIRLLEKVAEAHGFSLKVPVKKLSKEAIEIILYGTGNQKYEMRASLIYDLINNTNTFLFELKSKPVIKN